MTQRFSVLLWAAAVGLASLAVHSARAGGPGYCGPHCSAPAPCAMQAVNKVVMVPHVTYKTTTVPVVVLKPVTTPKTITVCKLVPETRTVSRMVTVLEPQTRTRMETFGVCRMTYEDVEREVTVMVPRNEVRQGMRTVCKPVLVQEMQTVCQDAGQWETKPTVDCHGCASACRVWCPQIVRRQVPVMVCKQQISQEPYQYHVSVCRPERRRVVERVCKPVIETESRQVTYTVCVPKHVERQFQETVCREVRENVVVNCTELVPTTVQRQVAVPVCTMVPKTVVCYVPMPCGSCGPGRSR